MWTLFWWVPFGRVPEISSAALHERLNGRDAPLIIDVRTPKEWSDSRIDGAVNMPVSSLRRAIGTLDAPLDRPIVTICLSAHRSIPAVRLLRAAGYTDVRQLEGGMKSWWSAGFPVVEGV